MSLEQTITPQDVTKTIAKIVVDNVVFRFQQPPIDLPSDVETSDIYAFANVSLYDNSNATIDAQIVFLTKDELDNWSSDDSVVLEIVKTKLGLQ